MRVVFTLGLTGEGRLDRRQGQAMSCRVINRPSFSGTFNAEAKKVSGKLGHVGHPAFMVSSNPKSSSFIQQ